MNCQSRDLAIVVRDTYGAKCIGHLIGTPVEVVDTFTSMLFGRLAWNLKSGVKCRNCGYVLLAMYDADLQPIRGPRAGVVIGTHADKPEEVTA